MYKGQVPSSTRATAQQLLKKNIQRLRCNAYNVISLQETIICLMCNIKRQISAEFQNWNIKQNIRNNFLLSVMSIHIKTSNNMNNIHWKQIPNSKKQYQKQCSSTTAVLSLLFIPWFQLEHAKSILNGFVKNDVRTLKAWHLKSNDKHSMWSIVHCTLNILEIVIDLSRRR